MMNRGSIMTLKHGLKNWLPKNLMNNIATMDLKTTPMPI